MTRAPITVRDLVIISKVIDQQTAKSFRIDVAGSCNGCNHLSAASFIVSGIPTPELPEMHGDLCGSFSQNGFPGSAALLWHAPERPKPTAPEHLPDNILRAYLEAEKAYASGIFGLAAAGYRKAVDRAITPLIGDGAKGKMLGPKIGMLERSELLPPAMLDWIRVVKDDGNFALHDDDHDFETKEQIEPARDFAHTLLTYLYTLPEKVRLAREKTA